LTVSEANELDDYAKALSEFKSILSQRGDLIRFTGMMMSRIAE